MSENTSPPLTTGAIIAKMVEIRDEKRRLKEREKELTEEWRTIEMEFLVRLDEQGMKKASTDDGTASITEVVLPQVTDWDAVYEHIRETGDFYLLQKRPAAAAFRELNDADIAVPGIEAYTKRSISLRKS
jgi:hypothetical protein